MIKDLTIFSSSVCNLKCTYCYVQKESSVFEYDSILVEALKSGEYIDRFKKDFPESISTLESLETWGAEPSIHLDIVADKLKDFKTSFPNIKRFMMSSNYTTPCFVDNVQKMLTAMSLFPETNWSFILQCSIDGMHDINDKNRGNGTTDKIIENLNKIKALTIPENIMLYISNKATISKENFDLFLDYEYCKKYYSFFKKLFSCTNPRIKMNPNPPTCVEPIYYTKNDGCKYSLILQNFIKLSKEENYDFIPYVKRNNYKLSEKMCGGLCSQCHSSVIMLPNGYYGTCHRSSLDIVEAHYLSRCNEFKTMFDRELMSKDNWLGNINIYNNLRRNMKIHYSTSSKMFFTQFYNEAKVLRNIGEISPLYFDDNILKEHIKLFMQFTICLQTNKDLTGSYFCCSSYFIPLFFNGAMYHIYDYLKQNNKLDIKEASIIG